MKEYNDLFTETNIALECPYCNETIYETLSWFKKAYSTCPNCDQGLVDRQFTTVLSELEQSMEESIEEMIHGQSGSGCCGKKSSCGKGGCS